MYRPCMQVNASQVGIKTPSSKALFLLFFYTYTHMHTHTHTHTQVDVYGHNSQLGLLIAARAAATPTLGTSTGSTTSTAVESSGGSSASMSDTDGDWSEDGGRVDPGTSGSAESSGVASSTGGGGLDGAVSPRGGHGLLLQGVLCYIASPDKRWVGLLAPLMKPQSQLAPVHQGGTGSTGPLSAHST